MRRQDGEGYKPKEVRHVQQTIRYLPNYAGMGKRYNVVKDTKFEDLILLRVGTN